MPQEVAPRFRAWCFTWNNYAEEHIQHCLDMQSKYIVFGREVCPTTGTPHLQGFVYFESPKTRSAVSKLFLGKCWVQFTRGSPADNFNYCTKEEREVFERGVRPRQGKRFDIDDMKKIMDDGGELLECFEADFETTVKYYRGFERYMQAAQRPRTEAPKVYWRWGKSGVGKTRWVYDNYKDVYSKPVGWFDGYRNQDCMLIDDYSPEAIPEKEFLKLTDRYPYMGRVKGSFMHINVPTIVVTCDSPPERFWSGNDLVQVMRRMTVVHVTGEADVDASAATV